MGNVISFASYYDRLKNKPLNAPPANEEIHEAVSAPSTSADGSSERSLIIPATVAQACQGMAAGVSQMRSASQMLSAAAAELRDLARGDGERI